MRDHIKILGILNIVLGSLSALAGLVALLAMGSLAGFLAATMASTDGGDFHDRAMAAPIIGVIGIGVGVFFLLLGLPAMIGGWGLMHYRPWSRILMIIVSGFHLFHIPLGTALGAYGLWVLLSNEGRQILESGGTGLPAAPYGANAYINRPGYDSRPPNSPPV